jgi:hypothetical protein
MSPTLGISHSTVSIKMIDSRLPLGLDRLSRTLAQTSMTLEGLLSSHDSTEPFGNDVVRLDNRNRIDFAHRNTPAVECHENYSRKSPVSRATTNLRKRHTHS